MNKKQVRQQFRDAVFGRDKYKCVMCSQPAVDAHHITNRNLMPGGGYIKENGISLCADCHMQAETCAVGFEPDTLYLKIKSSYEKAMTKCISQGSLSLSD